RRRAGVLPPGRPARAAAVVPAPVAGTPFVRGGGSGAGAPAARLRDQGAAGPGGDPAAGGAPGVPAGQHARHGARRAGGAARTGGGGRMITIFVLGIIVALLVEETTGVVPGGVIVPGFLALHVADPARLGATLLVSLAVYGIVLFLQGHVLLYGRRRF